MSNKEKTKKTELNIDLYNLIFFYLNYLIMNNRIAFDAYISYNWFHNSIKSNSSNFVNTNFYLVTSWKFVKL